MNEQETKNELLEFDWEDSTENFFGTQQEKTVKKTETEEETEEEAKKTEEETEEEKKTKSKSKKAEETEEDDDFFEEDETKQKEDNSSTSKSASVYSDLFKDLKEQGILKNVELEEDEELDVERFLELQEEDYETEVSNRLKNWATEELDEDARAFIKFKREGGNTQDFFAAYRQDSELPTGDIEDEDFQDNIIRYELRKEGWDRDEIEDRLEFLTSSGRKQKVAEKYNDKISEEIEENKKEILRQNEANKQVVKQQEENFKSEVKTFLESNDNINGLKINNKDKNTIYNFLTKKDQKISDNKSITGFQKKLSEVFKDTNKIILLAKLIESDFNMSDFEKKADAKKTKEIKTNLEQRKSMRTFNSGSSLNGSSLADLF